MTTTTAPRPASLAPRGGGDVGFLTMQRRLVAALPAAGWVDSPPALELSSVTVQEAPRLIAASVLEGRTLRSRAVEGEPRAAFSAFLDGTQTSRVIAYAGEIPIVHGSVAGVVRQRVDRRLRTWGTPRVDRALYVPTALLSAVWTETLAGLEIAVVDTLQQRAIESPHPFAFQDAAIHAVQRARESVERVLGEEWCAGSEAGRLLFVDGSISGSERVATSADAVGVVKSHRTLYAEGDALRTVLRLERGQRSSVFRITSPKRTPVASWYLRLRDARGRDPLWGLVRVEIADRRGASEGPLRACADEVSRRVLAEALPLAVPDARWDKMVYGVRDCEEFLRAIQ